MTSPKLSLGTTSTLYEPLRCNELRSGLYPDRARGPRCFFSVFEREKRLGGAAFGVEEVQKERWFWFVFFGEFA